jgi:hypothetical protein
VIGHSRPARSSIHEPSLELARLGKLAPRPTTLAQTGLTLSMLGDLTAKHLVSFGTMVLSDLVNRLGLSGAIVEQILQFLRGEGLVEVRGRLGADGDLRYGLTDRGRAQAIDALMRSGYVGPAPVPLEDYCDIVERQSIRKRRLSRDAIRRAFADMVLSDQMIDRLGPALNSGRAIFLHGIPGTGKTFVAQRLARVTPDLVLVPYAIAVGETVVEVFDPLLHVEVSLDVPAAPIVMAHGWDSRYACCDRPIVTAGAELNIDMLEVQRDPVARTCIAPLQLKANNGVFIIDDLGRQRVAPRMIFDRWIVPMEERRDYLSAGNGQHFAVPFDEVLIFSTNIEPRELADDAFLRRIGYKIDFHPVTRDQFKHIWRKVCEERGIYYDPGVLSYLLAEFYDKRREPLLPCHPRDLIGMALDLKSYWGQPEDLDEESIAWAWNNYFLADGSEASRQQQDDRRRS